MAEENRQNSSPESSAIAPANIAKLIADSNPDFPLTQVNAKAALTPPSGATFDDIKGKSGQGADIIFRFSDNTRFFREVKCVTGGPNAFNRRMGEAKRQVLRGGGRGDMFFQVREDYDVPSALAYFKMKRQQTPGALDKYRGLRLQIRDENGVLLFDELIVEE